MDNFYQIDFLSRMTIAHPIPFSTVTSTLAAATAVGFNISGTYDDKTWLKVLNISTLSADSNNISQFNHSTNQKKEVNNHKANLKHCKTIQCNMYLTHA